MICSTWCDDATDGMHRQLVDHAVLRRANVDTLEHVLGCDLLFRKLRCP